MRVVGDLSVLSATDLVGHIACEHLTQLELAAASGMIARPDRDDLELDVLARRGTEHELAHLTRLKSQGLDVVEITLDDGTIEGLHRAEAETVQAMRDGASVIYQGSFFDGRWHGRPDFLLRVDEDSDLGSHSYEVADTKLARRVRTGALIQMCAYSGHVARVQGRPPKRMHVVVGDATSHTYAVADFSAYYRFAKANLENTVSAGSIAGTYPEPVEHCDVCRWSNLCV